MSKSKTKAKTKAKTVEYMPAAVLGRIYIDMKIAGIKTSQVVTRLVERRLYSRRTAYRFFEPDKHGRTRENVTVDDGQNIIDVVSELRTEKGYSPLPYTARGGSVEDKEADKVFNSMRELLEQLIPVLDAWSLRTLAYAAYEMYQNRYPEQPKFYDFDLHPNERRHPPAWMNWEQYTPEKQDRLTKMYETAKARAEAQVSYHEEVERLHHDAEIIAGDRDPDNSGVEPAKHWAARKQSKKNDMTEARDRLQWWYDTCPGGEEYAGERQHLKEQLAKLEAEEQTAKESN